MKNVLLIFLLSLGSVFSLTGCETFEGMGEDAEDASEEIEDAVD
ncbi:MAG TPA: entericidin [Marinagarivorans sp.]